MNSRRVSLFLVLVATCGLWLLGAAAAGAAWMELPRETPLDQATVELDITRADIFVRIDDAADPVLSARTLPEGSRGFADVERWEAGLHLEPAEDDVRLRIDVRIRSDQRLRLRGRDVVVECDVAAEREGAEEPLSEPPLSDDVAVAATEKYRYAFELQSSQADFTGLADLQVAGSQSALWIRGSGGRLDLDLRGGSAEVQGHRGQVVLQLADSSVELLDVVGKVTARIAGGSLRIEGGQGGFNGTATDADIALAGWTGSLEFAGQRNRFDARDAARFEEAWSLEGEDLRATLEGIEGPVTARFQGGSLSLDGLAGLLHLQASGGVDISAANLGARVILNAFDGSEVRIASVADLVQAQIDDSSLRLERAEILALQARRSQVDVAGVKRLRRLVASDSRLDLDLSETTENQGLELSGDGDATIWLKTPCIVTLRSDDPERAGQLRVGSCDLRLPGQPVRSARNQLIHGHRTPTILVLDLDEDVRVVVEGRTVD